MENIENNETKTDVIDETEIEKKNNSLSENENNKTITISEIEYNKKIQSESDKVRTEYSKKIKELEEKIKELTPVEKSKEEIDFESRLAALEAREKSIKLKDELTEKGLTKELASYLRDDVNIEEFSALIENEFKKNSISHAYTPNNHKSGESMTKEEFKNLSMDKKEKIYLENPELYKTLAGR